MQLGLQPVAVAGKLVKKIGKRQLYTIHKSIQRHGITQNLKTNIQNKKTNIQRIFQKKKKSRIIRK